MSSYNPPSESITQFNSSLFNQPVVSLSQEEADLLYLSKTKNDISTASSTTFNGGVSIGGMLDLISGANTSELSQSVKDFEIKNNTPSGFINFFVQSGAGTSNNCLTLSNTGAQPGVIVKGDTPLFTKIIKSTTTSATTHTLFDNMVSPAKLTIGGTASTNEIRGNTTFLQNATIGSDGASNNLSIKGELRCYDTDTPYTSYARIINLLTSTVPSIVYEPPNVASSVHIFKAYTSGGLLTGSLLEINSTSIQARTTIVCSGRVNFSTSTPYSFPFSSNTSLGYYLKATGTAVTSSTYTSGTYVNLLTTSTIPLGVWRIDYTATNSVSVGGNITATDTMISSSTGTGTTTSNTPVAFTGSQNKTHTTENYGSGDSHTVNGSFTYQQSTAGVLYLVFRRTFVSGTYSWVGEVSITRLS